MAKGKKYYACLIPKTGKKLVTGAWKECEKMVRGESEARYKGFKTEKEAKDWLAAGADYGPRYKAWLSYRQTDSYKRKEAKKAEIKKAKQEKLEKGIYFDAGTGRGEGVEISVTDENGKNLLHKLLSREELNKHGKHLLENSEATNNYGELLALKYALKIAEKEISSGGGSASGGKKVFGDSKLVIDYWSKWTIKKKEVAPETVALAMEVSKLREEFEKLGGEVMRVSGDLNPADLGFHR